MRHSVEQDVSELSVSGEVVTFGDPVGSLAVTSSKVIGCGDRRNRFFFKGRFPKLSCTTEHWIRKSLDQVAESLMQKHRIESE